jgi:type III secretion protein R
MGFDPVSGVVTLLLVSLVPFAAVMVTSFTKIVIVFGLLKNALGLPQIPPATVTNGLALILSAFIMAPVFQKAGDAIVAPNGSLSTSKAALDPVKIFNEVKEPLREFMLKQTTPTQREFFTDAATRIWPAQMRETLDDKHLMVLIPTFSISEINKAFRIGFLIYLVFIVIDMIVANVLLALGMSMMQPTMLSAPIKLLLFIAVDGWNRLVQLLVLSYQ